MIITHKFQTGFNLSEWRYSGKPGARWPAIAKFRKHKVFHKLTP